ncbi:MAG: superoxide dismutase [Fe] [Candidatus Marinimicrobia bacterium]|nr:superoxide dismutase [Fe] [Candidatus Neomarinimicrobiota bacterium]MCH7762763.1 superoxide dismutase [Fe] [Candidatus Neomarinimicrobiota bacterium]
MIHELPALPYGKNELEPYISAETLDYHHGKHHQAYVTNLNNLIAGTDHENSTLEEIVKNSEGGLFNNAAQVWNHTFYWNSLSPNGGGEPNGEVADAINDSFGSYAAFKEQFSKSAITNFGSGWTWLVKEGDTLAILNTNDADSALAHGKDALLTIDVWEHAYYIDYRNARPKYVEAYWNLVNWNFANRNLV